MLLPLAVMLYAIEHLIAKNKRSTVLLNGFAIATLLIGVATGF